MARAERTAAKRDWIASPEALERLVTWLDGGSASGGRSYVVMHRRLASYFARKSCRGPDALADETLTRVARRLDEEKGDSPLFRTPPGLYCYSIARFVFLEQLRNGDRLVVPITSDIPHAALENTREPALACLDQCLAELTAKDRDLILAYYTGEPDARIRTRRKLADALGLSPNALMIRASRLRDRLRDCLGQCAPR